MTPMPPPTAGWQWRETAALPPPAPKPYTPPPPDAAVSDRSRRIAEKMRVPASLMEYGEVRLGALAMCVKACGRTSVLLYGGVNVCPTCARGGR